MRKTFITSEEKKAKILMKTFENRIKNFCPSIIRCEDFSFEIKKDFCSTFYIFRVFYEYPFYDLESILKNNIKEKKYFPHEVLMNIYYNILEALCFYQTHTQGHGYLQFFKIFKSTKDDHFKLIEKFSSLNFRDLYINNIYSNDLFRIFSPEILYTIHTGATDLIDGSKMDVYQLGIMLLALGNLSSTVKFYNFEDFRINKSFLESSLKEFNQRYSGVNPLLIKIVEKLLILNPKTRPYPL